MGPSFLYQTKDVNIVFCTKWDVTKHISQAKGKHLSPSSFAGQTMGCSVRLCEQHANPAQTHLVSRQKWSDCQHILWELCEQIQDEKQPDFYPPACLEHFVIANLTRVQQSVSSCCTPSAFELCKFNVFFPSHAVVETLRMTLCQNRKEHRQNKALQI